MTNAQLNYGDLQTLLWSILIGITTGPCRVTFHAQWEPQLRFRPLKFTSAPDPTMAASVFPFGKWERPLRHRLSQGFCGRVGDKCYYSAFGSPQPPHSGNWSTSSCSQGRLAFCVGFLSFAWLVYRRSCPVPSPALCWQGDQETRHGLAFRSQAVAAK